MDIVGKFWGFCNTLRHDGINYGNYIEQLAYLMLLKLADEKSVSIPDSYGWPDLKKRSGTDLLDRYVETLPARSEANLCRKTRTTSQRRYCWSKSAHIA
jgi:hypothetical protein